MTPDCSNIPGPSGKAPRIKRKARKSFAFEVNNDSLKEGGRERPDVTINASVFDESDQVSECLESSATLHMSANGSKSFSGNEKWESFEKVETDAIFSIVDSITGERVDLDISIFDISQGMNFTMIL